MRLAELSASPPRGHDGGMHDRTNAGIELFTYGSTNGHKVAIALEELDLAYEVHTVDVFAGEGRTPEFLAIETSDL